MDLNDFIKSSVKNQHIEEPGFSTLYVRKSSRYIKGTWHRGVFDVALVSVLLEGRGIFTQFLEKLLLVWSGPIYIENVLSTRFSDFLVRRGFESCCDGSFILVREPITNQAWCFSPIVFHSGIPILEWINSTVEVSKQAFDALQYATSQVLHHVECLDVEEEFPNSLICTRGRILNSKDCGDILRRFAKDQALSVIHLWEAPVSVIKYLESNNEDPRIREAVRNDIICTSMAAASAKAAALDLTWLAAKEAAYKAVFALVDVAIEVCPKAWANRWNAVRADFGRRVT